jgi:hypothetical protein
LSLAVGITLAAGFLLLIVALLPRFSIRKAQDRLAAEAMARPGTAFKLLTRADLVVGRYRRVPGVLGLTDTEVSFEGLFGESILVPTSGIQKISTGRRMASGRLLLRLEVLRIARLRADEVEFVLSHASAFAWRSHLGLWAVRERQTNAAEDVTPGRAR